MLGRVQPQLTELLLGFLDVIPECLLVPFHYQGETSVLNGMILLFSGPFIQYTLLFLTLEMPTKKA